MIYYNIVYTLYLGWMSSFSYSLLKSYVLILQLCLCHFPITNFKEIIICQLWNIPGQIWTSYIVCVQKSFTINQFLFQEIPNFLNVALFLIKINKKNQQQEYSKHCAPASKLRCKSQSRNILYHLCPKNESFTLLYYIFLVVILAETMASAEYGLWIHPGSAGFNPSNPEETSTSNK